MLNWRNITPSTSSQYMVKGTILNLAVCGQHFRFVIEEVRAYDASRNADLFYHVRDAHGVTDAQVRAGKRTPIVFSSDDLDACLAFVNSAKQ